MKPIPLAKPQITRQERKAVNRVLTSLALAQGPEVKRFESEFSKLVDNRECVAVNSGTSALHLCLIALGIGPGDEVIGPSFTFAATANVVALVGATPVFVDIDPLTYCLNPSLVKSAITEKTKAIIAVHLYGLPADMVTITKIAQENSLLVVEDAAQAHMASIEGKMVGTFGDAAAFSFYPTKNMTSGEGGMIVLRESDKARICRLLRNQGMERRYQNEVPGFNLRMTDIHAAIGLVQLKKLPEMTEKRLQNAAFLSKSLSTESVPFVPQGHKHVFHQYTMQLKGVDRDQFIAHLIAKEIPCMIYYPVPGHLQKMFGTQTNHHLDLPVTDALTPCVCSLPIHTEMDAEQLAYIVAGVKSFFN
jgi:dTDP-4-amino-4,6-dideoxygalactose transaminase